jgi:membrane fusion protein, copper/silver efflux system
MSSVPGHRSTTRLTLAVALPVMIALCFFAGKLSVPKSSEKSSPSGNVAAQVGALQPASYDRSMASGANLDSQTPSLIKIDPEKQQLIGVKVVPVEKTGGIMQRRLSGTVVAEDSRIYRVSIGVDGWLRETFDASIGSQVKKGEKLASFWSPEFTSALNSYLVATDRTSVAVKQASLGIDNASLRLRNLGMSADQIQRVAESRKIPDDVDIVSPADGFIVTRNAMAGSRFDMGTEFYRIADLNKVWILADFTESEAQGFRPGIVATITLKGGKTIQARVTDALPQFNRASQTMRLRLEAANPEFNLRPDMLVDVQLPQALAPGLTVPAQAVLDSGKTKRVFIDRGNGYFEAREVQTGWRLDDRVEIVSGLKPGERVVAAGAFLVDSEARLKSLAAVASHPSRNSSMPSAARP